MAKSFFLCCFSAILCIALCTVACDKNEPSTPVDDPTENPTDTTSQNPADTTVTIEPLGTVALFQNFDLCEGLSGKYVVAYTMNLKNAADQTHEDSIGQYFVQHNTFEEVGLTGYSGTKVYQGGGCLKFGTSSLGGTLNLPVLDLPTNFKVQLRIMAYWQDEQRIVVRVNGERYFIENVPWFDQNDPTYDSTQPYQMPLFEVSATNGGAGTTISVESAVNAKGRLWLDEITVGY